MPRKPGQPTITIQLTDAQRAAIDALTDSEPINQYVRRLIAEDAKRRKLQWPTDIGTWNRKTGS